MKKLLCAVLAVGLVAVVAFGVYAGTTSGPITVTAAIQAGTPDMTVKIYKMPGGNWQNINWNSPVTSMAFDKFTILQREGKSPQWTTVDHFCAFAYADGLGRRYQITSTGTGTWSGTPPLPAGSFACIPVYAAEDGWDYDGDGDVDATQGTMPSGAALGSKERALTSNKVVYTSENPGSSRIIQVQYAFPPYNADGTDPYLNYAPIPSTQTSGTYTGVTVTLNIAPIA